MMKPKQHPKQTPQEKAQEIAWVRALLAGILRPRPRHLGP